MVQKGILLIFLGILLVSNIGFTMFVGGIVAHVTNCATEAIPTGNSVPGAISSAAVTGNATGNWTLGANLSVSTSGYGSGRVVFNTTGSTIAACINITADNVVFDMNGSVIQLSNAAGSTPTVVGIRVEGANNVTIRDGYINVSTTSVTEATANYFGIMINGSSNVTIINVSMTSMSGPNVPVTTSIGINISNLDNAIGSTPGGILINNTNISNVSTAGIKIENSTNVTILNSWFNAGGSGTWLNGVPAISATHQNVTSGTNGGDRYVNVTTTMFNSTLANVTVFFYGNLSFGPQHLMPLPDNLPAGGGAIGGTKKWFGHILNFSSSDSGSIANITFHYTTSQITTAPAEDRLTIHRLGSLTGDVWSLPMDVTRNLWYTNSVTATNVELFSAFALFGDDTYNNPDSSTTSNPYSGKSDVPNPTLDYSCSDKKITVKTESELSGGSISMKYYCAASASCGSCNGGAVGNYDSSISSDGTATFDYFGPGEYQFEVTSVGSSENYRPTVWYNSNWACYKPDESCTKECTPTKESCADGSSIETKSCDAQGNLVPTNNVCPKSAPPPAPEPEPEPQPAPTPAPTPSPTPQPPPQPPKVTLDLTTPDKAEVGKEFVVKATKDGKACTGCSLVVKGQDGKETKFTTDKNGEAKVTLANKGSYDLSLLTDQGTVAKKRTVSVELALGTAGPEKKTGAGFLEDPGVQTGLIVVVVVLVLAAVYFWFTGQGKGKPAYKK